VNTCTFIGRLTRDPELRYTQSNTAVCKSAIAINTGFGDKKKTLFLDFTVFGKRAEAFQKFHAKGAQCAIQGLLEQQEWHDKNAGEKRTKFALVVNDWWFVGAKQESPAPASAPRYPEPDGGDFMGGDDAPF